ncbi:MAG: acetoacetate--CoA ligase [Hoeflea sp.]|nr:acetoacetate--CoA ligase [Hoeflea sp.]
MTQVMWTPEAAMAEQSALSRFAREAGFDPADYDGLYRWSISDIEGFWSRLWDFAGVIGEKGSIAFVPDPAHWMTGARFFPDAKINLAENLLKRRGDDVVVIEGDEAGGRRQMTADQLRAETARVANGLRAAGVKPGDRVAAVLPNRIECLVTLLATAAVGAAWTSCSPDFGGAAISDRIGQVQPKVLFVQPNIRYGGKALDISERLSDVTSRLEGLEQIIVIGEGSFAASTPMTAYADFGSAGPLEFTRVGFNDPVYILYTSGTTGKPKAIVHRAGGVLLQHVKEHMLHGDVRPGDRLMWYSNSAWMMYHWMVSALACDATIALYDGAPILKTSDGLDCGPLWRMVEAEGLTHLGISPKYLATLGDNGFAPGREADVSSLRWLMSAGSPVAPHQYDWMYEAIKPDLGFASISGGTEILGCFLIGSPLHPVRRGMLTTRALGLAVNVLDERGAPVIGRAGELVCTEPFPAMPLTFWGEGGDERYRQTYFADRAEIWTHGDRATLNADGSAVIHGRSDFTLNPGGVRIGTADIYNVCEQFADIEDCITFGRPVDNDEEIVLCLKMGEGRQATPELASSIRTMLRKECSPRHVPAAIYMVSDIPYTINGKRVEGACKAMISGLEVKNKASLANPDCLNEYARLSEGAAL